MTWEQYIRSNLSPKYTSSYTSTYYNDFDDGYDRKAKEKAYAKVWEGDIDDYNENVKIPWVDKYNKDRKKGKTLFNQFEISNYKDKIRDDEEYYANGDSIVYYNHPFYYREYHVAAKKSFISYYHGPLTKDALYNLKEGDVIEIGEGDNQVVIEINDYGDTGVLYRLKNMSCAHDKKFITETELLKYIKSGVYVQDSWC